MHAPTCSQGHTSQMTAADTVRLSLRDVGFTWMTPCRSFSGRLQTCCPPMYSRALTCMWNLLCREGHAAGMSQLCCTSSQLGTESSSPHTCLPSTAIRGLTTFPRVMWKEPDSVFSNTEEVNSVFRALGVKSARMSILERMRWVAQDKHVDFQQDPVTTPGLLQGATPCLVPALLPRRCPPFALSGSQSEAPESTITSKAVRSNSTMLEESSWSTPISEMGKYLCSFCRETRAP